jgi:site-specific recombinase XerD
MASLITIHQPTDLNPNPSVDEWAKAFALWLREFKSANTREVYERSWRLFYKFTNGLHPGSVETEHIRAWKIVLSEKYEPPTVNQRLSALSSFYVFVNEHYAYLRDDNPAAGVKQVTFNPYGKATLLVDEQDVELLNSIDRLTIEGVRDYAIIMLFLTTGVRLAAVERANNDSVRNQGAAAYFHYIGKGNKAQKKRLPTNTVKALQEWRKCRPNDAYSLFCMTRRQIQHMVVTRCDNAFGKGHGITVHSLRHTAANNASKHGSIQDVRSLLDHESTRITSIYLDHITNEQGERMSQLLDARYN